MQTVHKFVKRKKFSLLRVFSRLDGIKDYSVSNLLSLALYQVLIFFCLTRREDKSGLSFVPHSSSAEEVASFLVMFEEF